MREQEAPPESTRAQSGTPTTETGEGDFSLLTKNLGFPETSPSPPVTPTQRSASSREVPGTRHNEVAYDLSDLLEEVPPTTGTQTRSSEEALNKKSRIRHPVQKTGTETGILTIQEDYTETPDAGLAESARRTISEEAPGETELDARIVTVDQISDLSGLHLPAGATFEIEEIAVGDHPVGDKRAAASSLPPDIGPIHTRDYTPVRLKDFDINGNAEPETEEQVPAPVKKFSLTSLFKALQPVVVEYNSAVHGPLVDLTFHPEPGIEEIEMYPVNEPFAYIRIIYDYSTHEYTYQVIEPVLNESEQALLVELKERLFETLDINTRGMTKEEARTHLRAASDSILSDYRLKLSPVQREKILYNIHKDFLGNGLIDAIMHDKYIEDISCDGVNTPIFAFHASYESMQTTLMYHKSDELDSFVTKLAQRSGKYISIAEPILDATMDDGSRIQMTLGHAVTAHGSTFTIRKFKDEPITPTDLIEWHTFVPLSIAYIWLAVENGKSAIFAGGTASGKTTTLNAISLFIPPMAKIVSLEDTREMKLPHPNWIPSVTRDSFDTAGRGEINMYELLRAAMRQRPEYIIVGEVRGKECQTLFQAMSTGHVTYSTIHADSVASVVHRIENPPMDVPRNMLSALDIVCIQVQSRVGGKRIRRNKQIVEILDIDPRTNELITNEVFKWSSANDEIAYSGKSYILEEIMEARGWNENRMREELKRRQEVLEWMRTRKIRHYKDVAKILISYYREPEEVISRVRKDLYE
ncbi:MAG: type II/IV secretion system ATPase subunit [Methanoregula sp.]|nr:type II/IV secretion system ATPase subunit [Methanoregula sp.]